MPDTKDNAGRIEEGAALKPRFGSLQPKDFIRAIVCADLEANKNNGRVMTRFPPEPNGYLHIGHAKSMCLNFGIAAEVEGGKCNLRFDDTNPAKEDVEYVEAIKADVRWLGFLEGMKAGKFEEGAHVLRAKIDMASPNLNMRDPVIYRIRKAAHHRTGARWCIYPMYDFAHALSDSIEGITHSICTLEFEDHRPLYDWFLDTLNVPCHPQQIEFARLNLSYTVMSKRKLLELVKEGRVKGWDDPRMPTLVGLRRRGYTPESIRNFSERIGVAKRDSLVDVALLEHSVREDLNLRAPRVMAVLNPVRVVLVNYPEDRVEEIEAVNNPEDSNAGTRKVPFSRVLYIERDDFREHPPKKFFRLSPGSEVRLRYAYIIKCVGVVKDEKTGEITELHCTYDPSTTGGSTPDGRSVKGTLHWVSAAHAVEAEVRLYDRLFVVPDPNDETDGRGFMDYLNPDSLKILTACRVEPGLADATPGSLYQFERHGYFSVDPDSAQGKPVFNRTVGLRDSWAKIEKAQKAGGAV